MFWIEIHFMIPGALRYVRNASGFTCKALGLEFRASGSACRVLASTSGLGLCYPKPKTLARSLSLKALVVELMQGDEG